jgi:hypothetical protein
MAKAQYYIDSKNILYYDDGTGFKPKGNIGGLKNGKPVNVSLIPYTAGTLVDPSTGKPVANQPTTTTEIKEQITETPTESIKLNIQTGSASSSSLRYPSDPGILDESSDYVLFTFYKYTPPFGGTISAPNSASTTGGGTSSSYGNYASSNDRSYSNPADLDSIVLYMPEDIQAQFGAGWNGAGFGAAAAGLMNLAGSAGGGQDLIQKLQAGGEAIPGVLKAATFQKIVEGINAAAGANISANQALGAITGTILNPNVEMLYEAPKLRNFSLRFKMSPRSGNETTQIRKICNTFKKAILPTFGGQAVSFGSESAGNLITVPPLCQVSFMKGNGAHPYLPKFKLCGITDVNINYTADGSYATFNDGAPVSTELTVSFLESKLIFADEVEIDGGGI